MEQQATLPGREPRPDAPSLVACVGHAITSRRSVRMALGWADPAEPTNALQTDRVPLEDFATFKHA